MHLLTTPLLYRLLSFKASPGHAKFLRIFLSMEFTLVMVVHMVMDEFLLHAITFGLSVLLIVIRILKIIPREIPDPSIRTNMRRMALFGTGMFYSISR